MSSHNVREVKSRKQHRCLWCGELIRKSEVYKLHEWAEGDTHGRDRYHKECNEAYNRLDWEEKSHWHDEYCAWQYERGTTEEN